MRALARRITLIVVAVVALLMAAAPASAPVSGQTDISIDLDPLIILYYYSDVNVDISADALGGFLVTGYATGEVDRGATTGADFDADLDVNDDLDGDETAAYLALRNLWPVRALAGADVRVSVAVDTGTLNGPGGSGASIAIDAAGLRLSGGSGNGAADVTFAPVSLWVPQRGDVVLELDLTDATHSGSYTGGQFTVTAQYI